MKKSEMRRPSFRALLRYSLRRIWYPLWLAPIIVVAVLLPPRISGIFTAGRSVPETVAPYLLGITALIAAGRWLISRQPFMLWFTALLLLFFLRELHFEDTAYEISEEFVLGAFLILMLTAWLKYPVLGEHLGSRIFLTLCSSALFCYFISVGLDKHWWKFLPGNKYHDWQWVEEYVEITGHLFFLLLAIMARPASNPLLNSET